MDILRERVASVNLGRGDAPDSAAAAHRAAAAGAANVSFTFSSASEAGASPFASDATRLKEAGNAAFKAGRYQVATANYDEALERMAREFPTLRVPEALRDDCVAHEADASLAKKGKEALLRRRRQGRGGVLRQPRRRASDERQRRQTRAEARLRRSSPATMLASRTARVALSPPRRTCARRSATVEPRSRRIPRFGARACARARA
jgi:hypothetical protein